MVLFWMLSNCPFLWVSRDLWVMLSDNMTDDVLETGSCLGKKIIHQHLRRYSLDHPCFYGSLLIYLMCLFVWAFSVFVMPSWTHHEDLVSFSFIIKLHNFSPFAMKSAQSRVCGRDHIQSCGERLEQDHVNSFSRNDWLGFQICDNIFKSNKKLRAAQH